MAYQTVYLPVRSDRGRFVLRARREGREVEIPVLGRGPVAIPGHGVCVALPCTRTDGKRMWVRLREGVELEVGGASAVRPAPPTVVG
ncbi:MAG TPA: hypothetical protein VIL46_18790 [Gemmataceae bacterium]